MNLVNKLFGTAPQPPAQDARLDQRLAAAIGPQLPDPIITPYEAISENYKTNQYKRWLNTGNDANAAQARYDRPFFYVNSTPKFKFERSDKFFGIGSCFARNIERELSAQGMTCLTEGTNIPPEFYADPRDPRAAMNKFNIPSMIDEIERAFDPDLRKDSRYIELSETEYFDPATSGLRLLSMEEHAIVRERIGETTRRIADADCVVVTLGLVEMWLDRESGLFLNTSPHTRAMRQEAKRVKDSGGRIQNRFVHMRPNFAFLRDQMHKLIHTIAKFAPRAKVVISVSPVPLQATMTADDVVASSSLSKSLLRCVAEDARQSFDHVDYFPSYEMVMNSPRDLTWEEDEIHVKGSLVSQVTGSFVDGWVKPEAGRPVRMRAAEAAANAPSHRAAKAPAEAAASLSAPAVQSAPAPAPELLSSYGPLSLISVHIPKTAGTNFIQALALIYGKPAIHTDYGTERDLTAARTPAPEIVADPATFARNHRVIHGHYHYLKYKDLFPGVPVIATLRDPVKRVLSQYRHMALHGDPNNERHQKVMAGELDPVQLSRFRFVGNAQAAYLEGLGIENLAHAIIQEHYARTVQDFCTKVGFDPQHPRIQELVATPINSREDTAWDTKAVPIDPGMADEIRQNCAEDMAIYQRALERFAS
ncbi:GSCFA domain-containing protein [Paracoccus pacificus]|uniref:GSCFA domain-containing protein n=1 Tax=Paracoccus pacificus TaxID=1463598 RepID=A0ABW4R7I3_9RHOB